VCNNIDELHIQHGIIMPASMIWTTSKSPQ
jgi:hypothetical protein